MRVGLLDDSALFREALKLLLEKYGDDVVVESSSGGEVLSGASVVPMDAAIIDIRMPPTYTDEGIHIAAQLREQHPEVAILVLSAYAEITHAARLLELPTDQAGIGYLLKDHVANGKYLQASLSRLCQGEPLVDPGIAARLVTGRRKLDRLTEQERKVLQEMAEGQSNAGIATRLHLSVRTVEDYCAKVFDKLEIHADPRTNRRVNAVLEFLRIQT